jgi:mannose-6-phosphate isomerase
LPFLLKVLAAASPLSLQAHPTTAQARAGFARENAAGLPNDDPGRNYKDDRHKPEMIVALTPLRALCGFRPVSETRASIERLLEAADGDPALSAWLEQLGDDSDLPAVLTWLLGGGPTVTSVIEALVATAGLVDGDHFALVAELAPAFPGDPGIAVSLMLNLVELSPGEALFLPGGNIHAYLEGVGVELMAASDNVLRGGLTGKHIDVPELLRVLDFTPGAVPRVSPLPLGPNASVYATPADLALARVTGPSQLDLDEEAVALCTSGSFTITGAETESVTVGRGDAVYITGDERRLIIAGDGELFIASAHLGASA